MSAFLAGGGNIFQSVSEWGYITCVNVQSPADLPTKPVKQVWGLPPRPNGGSSVTCSVIGADFNPVSEQFLQELQNEICPPENGESEPSADGYGFAPVGAIAMVTTAENLTVDVNIMVELASGATLESVTPQIAAAVNLYFLEVRQSWGSQVLTNKVQFYIRILVGRILQIAFVHGVANVEKVLLNGSEENITCTENKDLQQLPQVGDITVTAI